MKALGMVISRRENGSFFDNENFQAFICSSIDKALNENSEYVELLNKCADASIDKNSEEYENLNDLLEAKAEELCYIQGWKDAVKMMTSSLN